MPSNSYVEPALLLATFGAKPKLSGLAQQGIGALEPGDKSPFETCYVLPACSAMHTATFLIDCEPVAGVQDSAAGGTNPSGICMIAALVDGVSGAQEAHSRLCIHL